MSLSSSPAGKQLQKAAAVSVANGVLNVCLAATFDNETLPAIARLQLADGLTAEFGDIVDAALGRCETAISSGESILAQYEAGSRPDECEIEYLKTKEHDFV